MWRRYLQFCSETPVTWSRTFLEPAYQDSIPSGAGVYAICARPPGQQDGAVPRELYSAVYVGRSRTLRSRFLRHCRLKLREFRDALADPTTRLEFWYTELPTSKIEACETLLIDCLGPPGNVIRGTIEARIGSPRPA